MRGTSSYNDYMNKLMLMNSHGHNWTYKWVGQRGSSDSFANFSKLSNPADAQNVSCLGVCGRDICPLCLIWAGYFQSSDIYIVKNK